MKGRLRGEDDGAPLAGAAVTLVDAGGVTTGRTLSDSLGAFELATSAAGPLVVHAEHPGYEIVERRVEAATGAAPLELVARRRAVDLPRDELKVDKRCTLEPEQAAQVADAWGEARKVFRASLIAQEMGMVRFQTETWYRQLSPRLRVVEEDRTPHEGFRATARMASPPPEELAREGYVRGGAPGEGISFFAPDAATLLSPLFTSAHCLGFDDSGPEKGWVGLTFRPLDPNAKDVEGTLWIDRRTFEPTRLEYRYTALPWPVKPDKTGGVLEFTRTANGAPIVEQWWMRMPRVEMKSVRITQWAEPRPRYTLSALIEEGGRVVRVQTRNGDVEDLR